MEHRRGGGKGGKGEKGEIGFMNSQPLRLRLAWVDTAIGERREPILQLPIALGRNFESMPATINGQRVSRVVLKSGQVSRFHAIISQEQGGIVVTDTGSRNGIFVNGIHQTRSPLANGDTLQIGPYAISISFALDPAPSPAPAQIFFNPQTQLPDPVTPPPQTVHSGFPSASFLHTSQVSVQSLYATGLPVEEIDYAAVGAGLGSFIWVDLLRISGVKASQIMALGMEDQPYARYQRLCLNSQIPPHERLRSNSDSCPDNIWGWPPYALREAWQELGKGKIGESLYLLWQVFAEPAFAETYTPRSGNVFKSIDREVNRIGWSKIYRYGRVRAIRKTDDGRYAIAYSRSSSSQRERAFLVANYVHLATGYPAIQFLPDLQAYREQTGDFKSVVNAYENHEHVYEQLERQGGSILLRGRGIVASRIVQRLYEARAKNPQIQILHLMRAPKPQGNQFGRAKRSVENHYEFQPFNWPKSCWGGELKAVLETVDPQQRPQILADLGGTSTANRADWRRIVQEGLKEGWYRIVFGEVERVERNAQNRTVTYIREKGLEGQLELLADFVVDATGLDAKVKTNPLLEDLVMQYSLPLNQMDRLSVTQDFEILEMRSLPISGGTVKVSGRVGGRMYAAGASTLGGFYAPVDSFLGLQYAALCSVQSLAIAKAPGVYPLGILRSFVEWFKWVANHTPTQE